ncbi:hypothetical protein JCM10450v2_001095 [Rhodotorula kratochvilovae]
MMSCTSATTALSCARGRYLTADKRCVLSRECPQNTFADATKSACTKCYVTDAATCKDASASGTTSCIAGCLKGTTCLPAVRMPGGFYCPEHVLTACPGDGVAKCDTVGKTTACDKGYNLNSAEGTCVKCVGQQTFNQEKGTCDLVCPDAAPTQYGAWRNAQYPTDAGVCDYCPTPGALSCGPGGVPTACIESLGFHFYQSRCVQCLGDSTFDSATGTCILTCPEGSISTAPDGSVSLKRATYPDAETQTCRLCDDGAAATCRSDGNGGSTTLTCVEGTHLGSMGFCFACGNDSTWDDASQTCRVRTPTCSNAYNVVTGYTAAQPAPFPGMPDMPAQAKVELVEATYLDPLTHTCIKCPGWSAYSCDSTGRTTACHDSYLLNGECTFNCNGNGAAAKVVAAPAGFTYAPMPWIGYRIGSFGVCEGST